MIISARCLAVMLAVVTYVSIFTSSIAAEARPTGLGRDNSCRLSLKPLRGDTDSLAFGLNDWGLVVGASLGEGQSNAVIWYGGWARRLRPLRFDSESVAKAVNNRGWVAGISIGAVTTAVRWGSYRRPRLLRPLAADLESYAEDINASGEVAGYSLGRRGVGEVEGGISLTPVVWDRAGNPRALAIPAGYTEGVAKAINDFGEAAGYAFSDSIEDQAVRWDASGIPELLPGTQDQRNSEAYDISEEGSIVGDIEGANEVGTLWDPEPLLLEPLAGGRRSEAFGINFRREAVGVSIADALAGEIATAAHWGPTGRPHRLSPLDGDLQAWAFAINDRGRVAGVSIGQNKSRGVVWLPHRCRWINHVKKEILGILHSR